MLIVPGQLQVFARLAPTDMRKSFSGLIGLVETDLGRQVEDGALFLFFNRKRDRLKAPFFTGDGAIILYKRLERGTFEPLRALSDGRLYPRSHDRAGILAHRRRSHALRLAHFRSARRTR